MFEIVVEKGGVEIHRVTVSSDVTIGRAPSAQIHLDDASVNRAHARLLVQGGALFVLDLDSVNGTLVDGRRIRGQERLERGARVQIGAYTLRRADGDARPARNPALDEVTGDDDRKPGSVPPPRVEVTDHAALQAVIRHVRLGRHFVFIDDAEAVMPPRGGRMQRLMGYKQKKGRVVKPLADAVVEIAGARIHPTDVELERMGGLVCDRDLYRAEQDIVRLLVAMPGGGTATIRVSANGAPLTERPIDVKDGVTVESLAMLLPGKYEAQLIVAGEPHGEPAKFTVAEYTLAPLSARLLEHRLDRVAQTLTVTLGVESYGVSWDRPLRGALLESGREVGEVALALDAGGRYTGRARVVGEGPFQVRVTAVDDPARTATVALPGTRKKERALTLAGELGKELFVSLAPETGAIPVRGLHVTQGDFLATPVVVDDVVADRAVFRANEDLESLVVATYDPARDGWSIHELGDLQRGRTADVEVPRPMGVAFVGCFIQGEPFEAFSTVFAPERAVKLEVPALVEPGSELAITVRTGRKDPVPMIVCVRDERLTATDSPQSAIAASTKRILEDATAGLGDDFRFLPLSDLVAPPAPPPPPYVPRATGYAIRITERGNAPRVEPFDQSEITIGRVQGNDIVLPKGNISKRHSRIVLRDGKFIIVDLKSTNGTFVNGKRISSPQVLKDNDKVYVGDFTLEIDGRGSFVNTGSFGERRDVTLLAAREEMPLARPSPARRDEVFDEDSDLLYQDDVDDAPLPAARAARDSEAFFDEASRSGFTDAQALSAAEESDLLGGDDDFDGMDDMDEQSTAELRAGSLKGAPAAMKPAPSGGRSPGPEQAPVRAVFPEVLFCGRVDLADGEQLRLPTGDSLGAFVVEVFYVDRGDFGEARSRLVIDKAVRADLDIAPEIDPEDKVVGVLRVASRRGHVRAALTRDGKTVPLKTVDGRIVATTDALPSGTELTFDAGPGTWLATATDVSSGDGDAVEVRVGTPGVYRRVVREIVLLDKGKRMVLDGDMLSLRVLPGLDEPFTMLAHATAGYQHMCCEQTAAKILSAVVMFLSADEATLRQRAEEIILAGIAREKTMWRRGRGFSMYPEQPGISDYYTPKVVQYLWSLDGLAELHGISMQLKDAVRDGLAMADDVAHAFSLQRVPEKVASVEDAYAVAIRAPRRHREALELIAKVVTLDESGPRSKTPTHRVAERATLAYAAAALFAAGKTQTGLKLANEVLRQLNDQGRLYSTVDSVAAIALMVQLRKTGVVGGGAELIVNGARSSAADASALADQVESVEVSEGVAVLEVTRVREERWAEARSAFPLKVGFRDDAGRALARFRRGDKAELVVSLPKGYTEGDLVHVCLPPAMAWLEGGGRVKRFTADFEGKDELRIPVVVTHAIPGKQRFAVAVRNMFQEERSATPGMVVVEGA